MLAAGAMITALGMVSITASHSEPARMAGANAMPSDRPALIRHDLGDALSLLRPARQMRKVGFPVVGPAEQRAEFARTIRMDEIVALAVDEVDCSPGRTDDPDAVQSAPHVDIDHEDAERLAVVREDRRCDAGSSAGAACSITPLRRAKIERRDVDLSAARAGWFPGSSRDRLASAVRLPERSEPRRPVPDGRREKVRGRRLRRR